MQYNAIKFKSKFYIFWVESIIETILYEYIEFSRKLTFWQKVWSLRGEDSNHFYSDSTSNNNETAKNHYQKF